MAAVRRSLRLAALALGLAIATAGALGVLLFALSQGFARERLTAWIADRLGASLGVTLRIGSIEGTLFDGFVARDVEIRAGDAAPLSAAAIELRYRLEPLVRERRLVIDHARIESLRGRIESAGAGWRVSGLREPLGTGTEDADPERDSILASVEIVRLEIADSTIDVRIEDADEPTALTVAVEGAADAIIWRSGTPAQLPAAMHLELTTAAAVVAARSIDEAGLTVDLDDRSLRVAHAGIEAGPAGRVSASGSATLADTALPPSLQRADLEVAVAGLDLAAWSRDPQLASALDGSIRIDFAPESPANPAAGVLRADADLRSPQLGAAGIETLRLRGEAHTSTGRFDLEEAVARGAAGEITLRAAGDRSRLDAANLAAEIVLERLPAAWRPAGISGRLKLGASAAGEWSDPTGQVTLAGHALQHPEFGPAELRLEARAPGDHRLRIERFTLDAKRASIASEGIATLHVERSEPLTLRLEGLSLRVPGGHIGASGRLSGERLQAVQLDLAIEDLAAALVPLGIAQPVAGRLSGSVHAEGALSHPSLRGTLVAAPLVVDGRSLERVELEVEPAGSVLSATLRVHDAGHERVAATARVADAAIWSDPAALARRSDSTAHITAKALDVSWLGTVLGRADDGLSGRIDLDATLIGDTPLPRVEGTLRLAEGHVAARDRGAPIGPIEADLRFDGSELHVEKLHVAGSKGSIRANGTMRWSAASPGDVDLHVAIERFALPAGLPATGALDGSLALGGSWPAWHLGGRVALVDGHVSLDVRSDPVWKEIRIHGLPGEEGQDVEGPAKDWKGVPEILLPTTANVELVVSDTRVEGRGADLVVGGSVRVIKQAGEQPLFVGSIAIEEGRFKFHDRRFEIERGIATLAGTRELDPELDVIAVMKQRSVTLRVLVSGRASAPQVSLDSDPPLDPADQLSYLAFGRPAAALGTADSVGLESAATQVVSQLVLQDVASNVSNVLPIGDIEFEGGDATSGPAVGIGGVVAPGVYLRYAHDLDGDGGRGRVEWRFLPRWSLESEVDVEGSAGADVIWTYDW